MIKGLLGLVAGTFVFWGLVTYPARLLWPEDLTFLWSTTAATLCLVPATLTLVLVHWVARGEPEKQLLAVMGGTVVRMLFVVAVGAVLFLNRPEFAYQRFWLFVIVYYLFTLALEVMLVVRDQAAEQARQKN